MRDMRPGLGVAGLGVLALVQLAGAEWSMTPHKSDLLGFDIPYHGVNVGNWLIPENWMSHVFDGVVAWDLHSLVQKLGQQEATRRVEHHRSTFMNEGDFWWMSNNGVNSVRLAFGYWDVENTKDYPTGGLVWMDRCFEWCKKYGITVMLDFHGLPGSQNADAHSGTTAGIAFQNPANVAHALKIVEFVVKRYKDHPQYIGIDLANEPVTCGPDGLNNGKPAIPVDVLKKYYTDAYNLVRKITDNGYLVFDTPYGPYPGADPLNWWQFMMEPQYKKTANDYHYYQLYTPTQTQETMDQHLAELGGLKDRFIEMGKKRPMVAGEWSFALPDKAYEGMNAQQKNHARKLWAAAQLKVYENWLGFYFFNYKSDVEDDNWSFTTIVKNGGWPKKNSKLAAMSYHSLTTQLIEATTPKGMSKLVAAKTKLHSEAADDSTVQTSKLAAIPQPQWRPGMRGNAGVVQGTPPHPVTGRVDQLLQMTSRFSQGHVDEIFQTQADGLAVLGVVAVVAVAVAVYGVRRFRVTPVP